METAKTHIKEIVDIYIKLRPEDYALVIEGIRMQKGLHLDEFATASLAGSETTRGLFEIPVELSEMLITGLSEEEMEWFKAGGANRKEGGRWFAQTFKEFALPESI